MPIKKFTFYNLGRDLHNIAPGFGLTVDYDVLEALLRTAHTPTPPDHLRDEFKELAEENHCDFHDYSEHRFLHFVKRYH